MYNHPYIKVGFFHPPWSIFDNFRLLWLSWDSNWPTPTPGQKAANIMYSKIIYDFLYVL